MNDRMSALENQFNIVTKNYKELLDDHKKVIIRHFAEVFMFHVFVEVFKMNLKNVFGKRCKKNLKRD